MILPTHIIAILLENLGFWCIKPLKISERRFTKFEKFSKSHVI